jgi:hypothetical protein
MTQLRSLAPVVVILGTLLAGPSGAIAAGPNMPTSDRELVLGLRVAPPFVMKTPDGIWTGISVELWRHLAEQLSLRYRFEETTQEGLLEGLANGTLDASGGALTVTAERLREVDFSLPYFVTGLGVAVPLRASLDWIGVATSFLTIRFLSVVLGIAGVVLLVSVTVWLLERRRTAEFGGPPVDGLVCSISWSTQAMAKANPSVEPRTRPGRVLGGAWTAASVGVDRDVHRGRHQPSDDAGIVGARSRRRRSAPMSASGRCAMRWRSAISTATGSATKISTRSRPGCEPWRLASWTPWSLANRSWHGWCGRTTRTSCRCWV